MIGDHAIVLGVAAAVSALGFLSGIGGYEIKSSITSPPKPISMNLKHLTFEDGRFEQEFYITGTKVLEANWAAEINRGDRQLCFASGTAPYQNEKPKSFPPDGWAGQFEGDCGPLQSGDTAIAVWAYKTEQGLLVRVSGEITIDKDS